jgi:hypothetical protein
MSLGFTLRSLTSTLLPQITTGIFSHTRLRSAQSAEASVSLSVAGETLFWGGGAGVPVYHFWRWR